MQICSEMQIKPSLYMNHFLSLLALTPAQYPALPRKLKPFWIFPKQYTARTEEGLDEDAFGLSTLSRVSPPFENQLACSLLLSISSGKSSAFLLSSEPPAFFLISKACPSFRETVCLKDSLRVGDVYLSSVGACAGSLLPNLERGEQLPAAWPTLSSCSFSSC